MITPQLSIRATLFAIISVLNIMIAILAGSSVYNSWVKLQEAHMLTRGTISINFLYKAERYLSLERGASLSVIYVSSEMAKSLQNDIAVNRTAGESALNEGLTRIQQSNVSPNIASLVLNLRKKQNALQTLRDDLDATMKKPIDKRNQQLAEKIFTAETDLIIAVRDIIIAYSRPLLTIDATISQQMMFKYSIWEITEYAGREYAVIGNLIAENKALTPETQEELLEWRALIQHNWEITHQFISESSLNKKLAPYISEAETHYFLTFEQIKNIFYAPALSTEGTHYPLTVEMWLELASQAVDSLLSLKDVALQETQDYVDQLESRAKHNIIIDTLLFLCAAAISLYCFAIIAWRVIAPIDSMVNALYLTSRGLPHNPLPDVDRHDEIGKLASVLEAFQESAKKLQQSNDELERYAYIASHDLKSPLRAIDNLSQWIEEDLDSILPDKTREYMTKLRQRVQRMEKLLNDTLEYSRIGHQPANDEIINGKALIDDVLFMAAVPKSFTIIIDEGFSHINLNRLPLEKIFYNLINNAIKHHESDKGTLMIGMEENASHYTFSVKDDGPGIPPLYHKKVFEMFQTLKPRDHVEGSGMGLAIVKKILLTRNCEITLISDIGQGTEFRFTWPKNKEKETNNA